MLQIINLSKKYGKKEIFNNFNYSFDNQYLYFLTQENGSGKTTFFKCLLREINYTGVINDQQVTYAYLPEKVNYPSYITVLEFIKMFLDLDGQTSEIVIDEYLKAFGIFRYKKSYIQTLSKGTKQKVLIIKTVLSKADVYLFDEPLTGLDSQSRNVFMGLIKALQEEKKIVIIATHYFEEYRFNNKKVLDLV